MCEILVLAAAAVSVVIWRYAIGRSLSIWNARMMQLHIFLWSHSRRTRARSSSSFVPLADFKLQLRLRDMMGELSRGVRGVVFVFYLLLNFQFVFSLLDTFGHRPVGQRPSLGLRLGLVCGRLPGPSLGPSSDSLLHPPFKSDPFLIDSPTQDGNFWARSSPALF